MKETMSVHKALSELKVLDSRISGSIGILEPIAIMKHSNAKIGGLSVAEWCTEAKSSYQAVRTLINRRDAIKRGVTRSNAVTMVTIGGKQYTVAEAIEMKNHGLSYLTTLCGTLTTKYASSKRMAEKENDSLQTRADTYIKELYAGTDLKNMSTEVAAARDTFIKSQTVEIVDPIEIKNQIDELQKTIDTFTAEVDSALSESNALTNISVEYDTL